jgi:hypothetical protein
MGGKGALVDRAVYEAFALCFIALFFGEVGLSCDDGTNMIYHTTSHATRLE